MGKRFDSGFDGLLLSPAHPEFRFLAASTGWNTVRFLARIQPEAGFYLT
jgi:hypothetical protein